MKIRIKANSVRFRLTRTEVKTLGENGNLEERTPFNSSTFVYSVLAQEDLEQLSASFLYNTIILKVPKNWIRKWNDNETVGFKNLVRLENGEELSLLLEKDFACLDNTLEDQSDNYPNPKA